MRKHEHRVPTLTALPIIMALCAGGPSHAEDKWKLWLEPVFVEAYGHDQHVLTIRSVDSDATSQADEGTAVNLDTDSSTAFRAEVRYSVGRWGCGVDLFWFSTTQSAPGRTAAADGPAGPIDEVVFKIADREFTSTAPGEVLFYRLLEDTELAVWTVDFYGTRVMTERPNSAIQALFGLRIGDFDNDYRAVVGIQDVAGTRVDASSNYDLMMGPMVGLAGEVSLGRNRIRGQIGQSVLIGSVELSNLARDFTGPFDTASFFARETLGTVQDVAVPVTEFRIRWTYRVSRNVSLGVGADTSAWWDVPVPPGVIPIEDGDGTFHENTIVFFGLKGAVEITF